MLGLSILLLLLVTFQGPSKYCKCGDCNAWLVYPAIAGVLDWDDCLREKASWDTLAWFVVLVGMASQLTSLGIVQWLADAFGALLTRSSYLSL